MTETNTRTRINCDFLKITQRGGQNVKCPSVNIATITNYNRWTALYKLRKWFQTTSTSQLSLLLKKECTLSECNHLSLSPFSARPKIVDAIRCSYETAVDIAELIFQKKKSRAASSTRLENTRGIRELSEPANFRWISCQSRRRINRRQGMVLRLAKNKEKKNKNGHRYHVRGYCISWASLPHISQSPLLSAPLYSYAIMGHFSTFKRTF